MKTSPTRPVRRFGAVAMVGAALFALLTAAAPVRAATAQQTADSCLIYFELTVKKAQSSTAAAAQETTQRIKNLDDAGAGDADLMGAATRGKRRINSAAAECSLGISTRGQQCIDHLTAEKAPSILIQQVIKARSKSLDQVAAAATAQKKAVDIALSAALAD